MLYNFEYSFPIEGKRRVFVPTLESRAFGETLCRRVLRRWTPPDYFFHFQRGGHVAATRVHLGSHLFVRLDLRRFYDSVTRTKVHRALCLCRFRHHFAWDAACQSTVRKSGRGAPFSLPFGFVQSPVLASLALGVSSLGTALAQTHHGGLALSVYMDDILISGHDAKALSAARSRLETAAAQSGFEFHPLKSFGPASALEVFNLALGHESLEVTASRLADFKTAILEGDPATVAGILGYVGTVNRAQRGLLAGL
ncbi:MAG TPA: reverse transcriptase domain-containing protein [Acetobacteraceae bacterium]|jgi:hypothetical protein